MATDIDHIKTQVGYSPETGEIISLRTLRVIGHSRNGYVGVSLRDAAEKWRPYLAHRIAFALMLGRWPLDQVDHVNMDRADNRWANLREATPSQNVVNCRLRKDNTSGARGVVWVRRLERWRARFEGDGKIIDIGHFKSVAEAAAVRDAAMREFFGERYRVL